MELPREFSLTKKTQTTFCLATEVVYFFGIVSEPICYNEIGYIYDNLYLLQAMFFSRNIESSYVPTIAYFKKKGIYDEHKFFMYSLCSWHVGSRAYYKK